MLTLGEGACFCCWDSRSLWTWHSFAWGVKVKVNVAQSCPALCDSQNAGVGSLSLLQGIFPTQGSNPGLPHCRKILYQLSHQGSPTQTWVKPPDCSWEIYCSFAEIGKFSRDENLRNREKYICCVLIEVSDETWKVVLIRCVISIGYYHRAIF